MDFGSEIMSKLKGLGVVKDSEVYSEILRDMDDGSTVRELIGRSRVRH